MITISTLHKGTFVPTFVFEDDDPEITNCTSCLTDAGIAFTVTR